MSYEFPPKLPNGQSKNYQRDIVCVTRSVRDDPKTGFCQELNGRGIRVEDFDAIKDDICVLRTAGAKKSLCSVDCIFKASDGTLYFIEFKKSDQASLEKLKIDGKSIEDGLRKKAFDSLALAGLTLFQGLPPREIMDKAVYIFVYLPSAANHVFVQDINNCLTNLAGGKDSIPHKPAVMWKLDALKTSGLFKDVHTWPENDFVSWAKDNLK